MLTKNEFVQDTTLPCDLDISVAKIHKPKLPPQEHRSIVSPLVIWAGCPPPQQFHYLQLLFTSFLLSSLQMTKDCPICQSNFHPLLPTCPLTSLILPNPLLNSSSCTMASMVSFTLQPTLQSIPIIPQVSLPQPQPICGSLFLHLIPSMMTSLAVRPALQ